MNDLPAFQLQNFTPYRVALAAQLLSEKLASRYRRQFGITIPEWRVLVHLVAGDGASVRDIENAVAMEKSKVSRTVTRLHDRGLLTKRAHPGDKRLVHLSLTDKGRDIMTRLLPVATEFQAELVGRLGHDFDDFAALLEKLIASFDEVENPDNE